VVVASVELRVEQVERADVERGRDGDLGAVVGESLCEVEPGLPVVEA
jgi:hypothetical protein